MPDTRVQLRGTSKREVEIRARAHTLEKQRKLAVATCVKPEGKSYTIACDEGAYLEGDDTAPSPLSYFSAAVAF